MLNWLFRQHGKVCASHPWEVMIGTMLLTTVSISAKNGSDHIGRLCWWSKDNHAKDLAVDVLILTVIRCVAILYMYVQLRKLRHIQSNYILAFVGMFTALSSLIFTGVIFQLFGKELRTLIDALPFFLLLIDLSKASILGKFALSASNQEEINEKISYGIGLIGPTTTLDTLVETLVIAIGSFSGVRRLEQVCCLACMAIAVNYIVFMTVFPACLSLVLQILQDNAGGSPVWPWSRIVQGFLEEEEENMDKTNPVIQQVKLVMAFGLMLVHLCSRLLSSPDQQTRTLADDPIFNMISSKVTENDITIGGVTVTLEQLITAVLATTLTVKFFFFDLDYLDMDSFSSGNSRVTPEKTSKSSQTDIIFCVDNSSILEIGAANFQIGSTNNSRNNSCYPSDHEDECSETEARSYKPPAPRTLEACRSILNSAVGPSCLTDEEILMLVEAKIIPSYKLETMLANHVRGVRIRRKFFSSKVQNCSSMQTIPYQNYDFSLVTGACCENVVGYVPVPLGMAGPLTIDGREYLVPMATSEGTLVASTNRGCRALTMCGGVTSTLFDDGMTRAPVVRLPNAKMACHLKSWLSNPDTFEEVKQHFDMTSRFVQLERIKCGVAGPSLFIRFKATTGDAMGMNMISKATEKALEFIKQSYPEMKVMSVSGNYCTDKKPSAINWIDGRGKSVVCDAIIKAKVLSEVLKTTSGDLVDLNISKNLIGSSLAGCVGGSNAHAANIVTAIFIATGQDPAQNVESSNCITLMERHGAEGEDLYISCTMPSIEVGTVGGGTILPAQRSNLEMLGVQGASSEPGSNSSRLAAVVCATVVAGELSLMSALATGQLVKSHLTHNRSSICLSSQSPNHV